MRNGHGTGDSPEKLNSRPLEEFAQPVSSRRLVVRELHLPRGSSRAPVMRRAYFADGAVVKRGLPDSFPVLSQLLETLTTAPDFRSEAQVRGSVSPCFEIVFVRVRLGFQVPAEAIQCRPNLKAVGCHPIPGSRVSGHPRSNAFHYDTDSQT